MGSLPAAASSGGGGGRKEASFGRGAGAHSSRKEGEGVGSGLGWVEKRGEERGGGRGRGGERPGAGLGRSGWDEERRGGGGGRAGEGGGKGEELLAAAEAVWRISEMAREVLEGELERRGEALAAAERANKEAGEAAYRQVSVRYYCEVCWCALIMRFCWYAVCRIVVRWCPGVQYAVWRVCV